MATHSSILLPGESHGQRSLWGYSPWGLTESDVTEHNNNVIGGLPRWLSGKESACQCRRCRRHRFDPWVGKIPWRRRWQPTPVFLPGESHGRRSLAGYSPQGCKELDTTEATQHAHMPCYHIKCTDLGDILFPQESCASRLCASSQDSDYPLEKTLNSCPVKSEREALLVGKEVNTFNV